MVAISSTKDRMPWIDVGKGIAIILVAIWHASEYYQLKFLDYDFFIWSYLSLFFRPIRMPLFFFISGILARSALNKNFSDIYPKTFGLLLLNMIWKTYYIFTTIVPPSLAAGAFPPAYQFAMMMVMPNFGWYIWALPVYLMITWVIYRRRPAYLKYALIAALVIAALSPFTKQWGKSILDHPMPHIFLSDVLANYIWFMCGILGLRIWHIAYAHRNSIIILAAIAFYSIASYVSIEYKIMEYVRIFIAPVGLYISAQALSRFNYESPISKFIAFIGRGTLPVYILHIIFIKIIFYVLNLMGFTPFITRMPFEIGVVLVPAVTLAAIVITRIVGDLVARTPFKFMLFPMSFKRKGTGTSSTVIGDGDHLATARK